MTSHGTLTEIGSENTPYDGYYEDPTVAVSWIAGPDSGITAAEGPQGLTVTVTVTVTEYLACCHSELDGAALLAAQRVL